MHQANTVDALIEIGRKGAEKVRNCDARETHKMKQRHGKCIQSTQSTDASDELIGGGASNNTLSELAILMFDPPSSYACLCHSALRSTRDRGHGLQHDLDRKQTGPGAPQPTQWLSHDPRMSVQTDISVDADHTQAYALDERHH